MITSAVIYVIPFQSSIQQWKGYLCLLLMADSLRRIFSVFSKGLNKVMIFSLDNILYTVVLFVANLIFLIKMGRGTAGYIEAAIIADICSIVFLTVSGRLYQYFALTRIDTVLMKRMVIFSLPLIVNAMSWWITNSSDKYIIEYMIGAEAVGMYSVATKLPMLITTFSSMFLQAWSLSSITAYENKEGETFYKNIWSVYSGGMILGTALLIALIKVLTDILVGKEFSDTWIYIPFLVLGAVFSGMGEFFSNFYIAAKKNVAVMLTTLGGAAANILLNIILIPYMGIQGAALSTALTCMGVWIYRMADTRKYVKFEIQVRRLIFSGIIIGVEMMAVMSGVMAWQVSGICILLLLLLWRKVILIIYTKGLAEGRKMLLRIRKRNVS